MADSKVDEIEHLTIDAAKVKRIDGMIFVKTAAESIMLLLSALSLLIALPPNCPSSSLSAEPLSALRCSRLLNVCWK